MRCPNCRAEVPFQKELFRGIPCKKCNSTLLVSETYSRVLVLVALLFAEASLWACNIRTLFYPTLSVPFGNLASVCLGFPVAFLLLTVMVRTLPRWIPPALVLRHWSTITTLGLTHDGETTIGSPRQD
jgi:DNA-directed RNA polymerase subunit RPC12/RpoP